MSEQKQIMADIAYGKISEPTLTLTVDGQQMTIHGRDCKFFAIGYLTGLKAAESGVSIEDATTEELERAG